MIRSKITLCMALALGLVLSGCGGGGSSGGGVVPVSDALVGQLQGWHVEGLRYETATESGLVGADQTFRYQPEELVAFKIGDTVIGESQGASTLTLVDLFDDLDLPSTNKAAQDALRNVPSFWAIARASILLVTLDDDNDPSNGIRIPQAVHDLALGSSLDLSSPPNDEPGIRIRQLRRDGIAAGLWGGVGRPIALLRRALNALYEGLGVSYHFARGTRTELGSNGVKNLEYIYSFEANGQQATTELLPNSAGIALSSTVFTYDVHGRVTERRDISRGTPWIRTYAYDANGNQIYQRSDTNGDGTPETSEQKEYNDLGYPIIESYDSDGDGTADFVRHKTYSPLGELTQEAFDFNDNGVFERVIDYSWDSAHLVLTELDDTNGDGITNRSTVRVHDARGYRLSETKFDAANAKTFEVTMTYNANGLRTSVRYDADGDGIANRLVETEYNELGKRTKESTDNDGLDGFDQISEWGYDNAGNATSSSVDSNADGVPDSFAIAAYDPYGNRIKSVSDRDGDGIFESLQTNTYTYDAVGNMTSMEFDMNGDGAVENYYVYDLEPANWWTIP